MRLAVYTDYAYWRQDGAVYAERAFAVFLAQLAGSVEHLTLLGRLHRSPGRSHYRLPDGIAFTPLPYYAGLAHPWSVVRAAWRSLVEFWRALDGVDTVWLLGPHPLSIAFAAIAALRGKRTVLGVRQDLPSYTRSRHPDQPLIGAAAQVLEGTFRALALVFPVVVVGPDLARRYSHSRHLLALTVSLVREGDILLPADYERRSYDGELRILSVGRLDLEKNPLLLADVLERLHGSDGRWRLVVCGEGPLESELGQRIEALGLTDQVELRGYVPAGDDLREVFEGCHALLHVAWTEGFPQVLVEAFAARLPVVATAVGGVPQEVGNAALLVPPGDPAAAAAALERVATDTDLRAELTEAGARYALAHTTESECRRLAYFLEGSRGT